MQEFEKNKTELRILEAAQAEFLEQGFDGARTVSIAERAGVTHAMLHYYYRSKEQLFQKILDGKVDTLVSSAVTAFMAQDKPFLQRVEEGISAHFDFLMANPQIPLFIVREIGKRDLGIERKIHEIGLQFFLKIKEEVQDLVNKGEIRPIDPLMLLIDIISQNVFPFMVVPVIAGALDITDSRAFLEQIKQENIRLIITRLKP